MIECCASTRSTSVAGRLLDRDRKFAYCDPDSRAHTAVETYPVLAFDIQTSNDSSNVSSSNEVSSATQFPRNRAGFNTSQQESSCAEGTALLGCYIGHARP